MKILAVISAVAGFSAVALGAFGAHALRPRLTERGMLEVWQTATLYHLVHAVALLVATAAVSRISQPSGETAVRGWRRAAFAWALGIVLFSGSLYVLALGGPRWLGPVTPIGGVVLLAGWILVAFVGRPPNGKP